jgi:flagellar biosynthesis protein FlhF
MKIKRFEASSMSEALRSIKKEFGEEAVILSAKTIRKGRFIGKKNALKVVVTAAIDRLSDVMQTEMSDSIQLENESQVTEKKAKSPGVFANGNSMLKRFSPITKTGQKILKPKFVHLMTESEEQQTPFSLYRRLLDTGLTEEIASEFDQQLRGLLHNQETQAEDIRHALSQGIQVRNIVRTTQHGDYGNQKCIAMVGPAGVGKTSAVAKMAAKMAMQQSTSVAIISMDNQRVAGTTELERFSKIIGVPFATAFTVDALKKVTTQLKSCKMTIIDTPGISPDDPVQREKLRRMLSSIDHVESYLLIHATLEEKAMARIIDFFKPLNPKNLLFTGLDWAVKFGHMINQSEAHHLPIGHLSNSAKIQDGLKAATAEVLAGLLLYGDQGEAKRKNQQVTVITPSKAKNDQYYVANSNSDIFHFHECKSVKRINTDNMIVFKDAAEAMGQQFKPCRMCCSELFAPKPIDRLARGYAGSRY